MKLNKSQRFAAYCIMLSEIENYVNNVDNYDAHDGFCFLILQLFGLRGKGDSYFGNIKLYFPELSKREPKNSEALWFPAVCHGGAKPRIEILKQCIIETHP